MKRNAAIGMNGVAAEIAIAKKEAGEGAYLWAHDSGDVILWASEYDAENDDGSNAVGRWTVDADTLAALGSLIDEIV